MNEIIWTRRARKQLYAIPKKRQDSIERAVEEQLPDFRESPNVAPLRNQRYDYRLRVGRYRVLFNHDKCVKIVSIEEVLPRGTQTY